MAESGPQSTIFSQFANQRQQIDGALRTTQDLRWFRRVHEQNCVAPPVSPRLDSLEEELPEKLLVLHHGPTTRNVRSLNKLARDKWGQKLHASVAARLTSDGATKAPLPWAKHDRAEVRRLQRVLRTGKISPEHARRRRSGSASSASSVDDMLDRAGSAGRASAVADDASATSSAVASASPERRPRRARGRGRTASVSLLWQEEHDDDEYGVRTTSVEIYDDLREEERQEIKGALSSELPLWQWQQARGSGQSGGQGAQERPYVVETSAGTPRHEHTLLSPMSTTSKRERLQTVEYASEAGSDDVAQRIVVGAMSAAQTLRHDETRPRSRARKKDLSQVPQLLLMTLSLATLCTGPAQKLPLLEVQFLRTPHWSHFFDVLRKEGVTCGEGGPPRYVYNTRLQLLDSPLELVPGEAYLVCSLKLRKSAVEARAWPHAFDRALRGPQARSVPSSHHQNAKKERKVTEDPLSPPPRPPVPNIFVSSEKSAHAKSLPTLPGRSDPAFFTPREGDSLVDFPWHLIATGSSAYQLSVAMHDKKQKTALYKEAFAAKAADRQQRLAKLRSSGKSLARAGEGMSKAQTQ